MIVGADDDSEWRVGVCPEVGLSFVGSVVVAVELVGVVILEVMRDLIEEREHLRGGLVGEVVGNGDERRGVVVHGQGPHDARDLAVRRERALERLAACSLASRSR